jgi:hypothetical protein
MIRKSYESAPCDTCNATGVEKGAVCTECLGTGEDFFSGACHACNGQGRADQRCHTCDGSGRMEVDLRSKPRKIVEGVLTWAFVGFLVFSVPQCMRKTNGQIPLEYGEYTMTLGEMKSLTDTREVDVLGYSGVPVEDWTRTRGIQRVTEVRVKGVFNSSGSGDSTVEGKVANDSRKIMDLHQRGVLPFSLTPEMQSRLTGVYEKGVATIAEHLIYPLGEKEGTAVALEFETEGNVYISFRKAKKG